MDVTVVVTLTTIPSRLHCVESVIASLEKQSRVPDIILLFLPQWSTKEKCAYGELFFPVAQYPHLRVIRTAHDYGPMTKVYPIVDWVHQFPSPDNTVVISVDDDQIQAPFVVERLLQGWMRHPGSAVGFSGTILGAHSCTGWIQVDNPAIDHRVDWLCGFCSVLYPLTKLCAIRGPLLDFQPHPEAFFCDDIWISGHLSRIHVDRWVVPYHYRSKKNNEPAPKRVNEENACALVSALSQDGSLRLWKRTYRTAHHFRTTFCARPPDPLSSLGRLLTNYVPYGYLISSLLLICLFFMLLMLGTILFRNKTTSSVLVNHHHPSDRVSS